MRKPEHQWETRGHRAYRLEARPEGPWAEDARAEAFELRFGDGRVGQATCGLQRQVVDIHGRGDTEIVMAVTAWLLARGQRTIDLSGPDGDVIARGPISPQDLSSPRPTASPRRVVSIAPSNAEILEALGCFDRVVAVEDSTDWPESVARLERLGPDLAPDLDRIAALEPDLVLASLTVPGMERNVTGLRRRGVPALVLAPRSLPDVMDDVARSGRYLHAEAAAARVVEDMHRQIEELRARAPARPHRVYLEWWPRPMFTPGRDCFSNALIELAGGINVFGDRPGSSLEIGPEALVAAEPEFCFVSWCGVAHDKLDPQRLIHRKGLEGLEAARRGRVHALDEQFSGRPGPRMLEAARQMAIAMTRGET